MLSGREVGARKTGTVMRPAPTPEGSRGRGSHILMQRVEDGDTTTVPVPDHRELRVGTLMSIIPAIGAAQDVVRVSA